MISLLHDVSITWRDCALAAAAFIESADGRHNVTSDERAPSWAHSLPRNPHSLNAAITARLVRCSLSALWFQHSCADRNQLSPSVWVSCDTADCYFTSVEVQSIAMSVSVCLSVRLNISTSGQVIWHKAASLPHIDGSVVLARWRHCAPRLICASFGSPESTSQMTFRSVQPFCTAHSIESLCFTMCPSPPSKLSFAWGIWSSHLIHGSLSTAVLAWLTTVTDGPTDRQTDRPRYSVCNNKPHLST